jgi:hypothetical protein
MTTEEIFNDLGLMMKNFKGANPALEKLYAYHNIAFKKKSEWPNPGG